VLGLRFTPPNNALTTIPALADVGTGGGSIAHLASGGDGWQPLRIGQYGEQRGAGYAQFLRRSNGSSAIAAAVVPAVRVPEQLRVAPTYTQTLAAGATLVIVSDRAPQLLTGSRATQHHRKRSVLCNFPHNDQEAVVPLESRKCERLYNRFRQHQRNGHRIALNAGNGRNK